LGFHSVAFELRGDAGPPPPKRLVELPSSGQATAVVTAGGGAGAGLGTADLAAARGSDAPVLPPLLLLLSLLLLLPKGAVPTLRWPQEPAGGGGATANGPGTTCLAVVPPSAGKSRADALVGMGPSGNGFGGARCGCVGGADEGAVAGAGARVAEVRAGRGSGEDVPPSGRRPPGRKPPGRRPPGDRGLGHDGASVEDDDREGVGVDSGAAGVDAVGDAFVTATGIGTCATAALGA
jgi:hypothetical protein